MPIDFIQKALYLAPPQKHFHTLSTDSVKRAYSFPMLAQLFGYAYNVYLYDESPPKPVTDLLISGEKP